MPRESCLIPYIDEIISLRRRKPPTPYSRIAELMREKYQLAVHREAIFRFIKNRSKGFKTCRYAWVIEPTDTGDASQQQPVAKQPVTKPPVIKTVAPLPSPSPARAVSKPPAAPVSNKKPKPYFDFPFSETYNLHRLTPEEVIALHKKLDEEEQ